MANKGARIFLLMQIFFVILGFAMFFGLKAIKDAQAEKRQQEQILPVPPAPLTEEPAQTIDLNESHGESCDYSVWVGARVDEEALKAIGRPYRILPPGAMATMDFNPERINVETDDNGIVTAVTCG